MKTIQPTRPPTRPRLDSPTPRPRSWRTLAAVVAVAMGVVAVGASSSSDQTATKVGSGGSTTVSGAGAKATTPSTFKVGDQVKLGSWTIVVNGVTDPYNPPDGFDAPDPGQRDVVVDATVTNGSSSSETVSSLACFTLQDSTAQAYDETVVTGVPKAPDGDVGPGQSLRGSIAYQVPTAATGLVLHFNCDLFSGGSADVALS
jgi:hypothetical protein